MIRVARHTIKGMPALRMDVIPSDSPTALSLAIPLCPEADWKVVRRMWRNCIITLGRMSPGADTDLQIFRDMVAHYEETLPFERTKREVRELLAGDYPQFRDGT